MGAPDLLLHLRGAGFSVTVGGGCIRIAPASALTEEHRQAIRTHRAELLALVGDRPASPDPGGTPAPVATDPDSWCWPHSQAMNGTELAAMSARIERYSRRGIEEAQAERLADLVKDCERQANGLRLCLDCRLLVGNVAQPWRCLSHRAAGVARDLPGDFVRTPQRCSAYKTET